MNYIVRICSKEGEVLTTIKADEHPSEDKLDQLVILHGGTFADVSRP